jgi:bifunctional DNA-binding transcriptional regulator/antitoxin component of YhaV-PrlF toxin-antitoxin module
MSRSKDVVRPWITHKNNDTMVVVIPKPLREELNVQKGDVFLVKKEGNDRLVYRRIVSRTPD